MSPPLITYFIPVYNRARTLPRLFKSLDGLQADKVELLFIDDGSSDGSADVIRGFCGGRANAELIQLPRNRGVAFASNKGILSAKGAYVTRCDSDDVLIAENVKCALPLLEERRPDMLISHLRDAGEGGRELIIGELPDELPDHIELLNASWERPRIMHTALFTRREILLEHQLFYDDLEMGEDSTWVLKVLEHTPKLAYLPAVTYQCHLTPGSLSKPTPQQFGVFAERYLSLVFARLHLGLRQRRRGSLRSQSLRKGIRRHSGHAMRWCGKAGMRGTALALFFFCAPVCGVSGVMVKEFIRSLPMGLVQLLLGRAKLKNR